VGLGLLFAGNGVGLIGQFKLYNNFTSYLTNFMNPLRGFPRHLPVTLLQLWNLYEVNSQSVNRLIYVEFPGCNWKKL